jgi:hypothetical protein
MTMRRPAMSTTVVGPPSTLIAHRRRLSVTKSSMVRPSSVANGIGPAVP